MSYDSIRAKAWPHRAMIAAGVVLIALSTFAAATPAKAKQRPFSLVYTASEIAPGQLQFDLQVIDNATGEVVSEPRLSVPLGGVGRIGTSRADREYAVQVKSEPGGYTEASLQVTIDSKVVQHTLYTHDQKTYDGEPMSVSLAGADIRDFLGSMGQMTGITFEIAPDVAASITMERKNVPWDKVLEDILNEHGLVGEVDGNVIRVSKKK